MPEPTTSSGAGFGLATNLAGGSVAVLGGFTTTEWMAIVGGLCAVLGLLIQAWATIRKDQRDERDYIARQEQLKKRSDNVNKD
jgi:heme exporter protein D